MERNGQTPTTPDAHSSHTPRAATPRAASPRAKRASPRDTARELRKSEQRYHALVEATGQIIWVADAEGRLIGDLAPWCAFTGQTSEQAVENWVEAIHPDDRERTSQAWAVAVASGHPYEIVTRVRRHDAEYRTMLVRAAAIHSTAAAGGAREWIGVCTDITERELVERERDELLARESTARMEAEAASERLHQLLALTDTALLHLDLDSLLQQSLDRIRGVMGVDNVAILLLTPDRTALTVRAARGLEEEVAASVYVPLGRGFAGRIAATRAPLIVNDLSTFDVVNAFLHDKLSSAVGVPLLVGEHVLGVVHIGTALPHHFTEDDVNLLQRAADRLALAIDHAQLFLAERRARAEAAAQASQLVAVIEAMSDGVQIFDSAGRPLHFNSAAHALLGITEQVDYSARSLADRGAQLSPRRADGEPLPRDEWPITRILRGEVIPGSEAQDIYLTHGTDGRERLLSFHGGPVRDAEGNILAAVIVCRDITERRRLERRTEEALAALVNMAEALVETADTTQAPAAAEDMSVRAVGRRLVDLTRSVLGCARVSLVALDDAGIQHPLAVTGFSPEQERRWWGEVEGQPAVSTAPDPELARGFFAGEVVLVDMTQPPYSHLPNPYGIHTMLATPLRIGERIVGTLALDHDGAEHEYTPQELTLAGAVGKLAALALERQRLVRERAVARAGEEAQRQANEKMDEFLSIAGHELRTPITSIKATIQLAERQVPPLVGGEPRSPADTGDLEGRLSRVLRQLDRADRQADRLDRLVGDLLDVSRIQAGKLELRPERTDLTEIVCEAVEEQRMLHPERTIACETPRDTPIPVRADSDRIAQVVTNYLTNALKYSPPDRPVAVRLDVEGQPGAAGRVVRVSVHDEGPGLPPEELDLIWERFHRAPGVEPQTGGVSLGLGLYISRGIVERHGGNVNIQSHPGAGSTFSFALPLLP